MSFLLQPYPFEFDLKKLFISHLGVALFIALFLIVFQPFGIYDWRTPHKMFYLWMFGLVCFISSFSTTLVVRGIFRKWEFKWVVWKEIVFTMSFIVVVTIGNFLYANYIGAAAFNLQSLLSVAVTTFCLGLFPATFSIYTKYKNFKTIHQKEATAINQELSLLDNTSSSSEMITLISENEKERLQLQLNQLLYIESADNYATIVYLENNKEKTFLIRSSLKRLESQINNPYVERCHRCYLVNFKNTKHIDGNAQGYKIQLTDSIFQVPVSRNFGPQILAKMQELHRH